MSAEQIRLLDAYWRAANYLTVGQIYLQDNPLLREPLTPEHIKPRLLGHWGTSPGPQLHLRAPEPPRSARHDADVIYLAGPGHGGPAIVANVYLEGTYSEIYPEVSQDAAGLRRLFRQFSTPGGIPSHVSVPTPGSIHEGGELGYVLVHAFGAAFDNPDLIVAAVVGDGEAETGPLAGSLEGHRLPEPGARRRGAADPAPQRLQDRRARRCSAASTDDDVARAARGHGYDVHFVEGDDPPPVHQALRRDARRAATTRIRAIQHDARTRRRRRAAALAGDRAAHAEGLDRAQGGGRPARRGHVPRAPGAAGRRARQTPRTWRMLEAWMRSYRPEELFDDDGRLVAPSSPRSRPTGDRRMGANPHANGGRAARPLDLPDFARLRARRCRGRPRSCTSRPASSGKFMRDIFTRNRARGQLPPLLPRRDQLEPAGRRVRGREPLLRAARRSADRRPRGAGRPRDGGAERALLPGLARGLPAHRPPRALRHLRGVRDGVGVDDGAARQVAARRRPSCRGARRSPR